MCLDPARNKSARSWLLLLTAGLLVSAPAARAADLNWLDIESRIQYGYFTEDTRSLHNLVEPLGSNDSHDRLKSYYSGLLAYRLTLLAQAQADQSAAAGKAPAPVRRNDRSKNEARQTVERCVGSLDQALEVQSNFAEALALQSACLGMLADLSTWRAPLAAPKSATQLRKALQLAPKNPRVLLLDAISDYEHAKAPGGDAEHPCVKFEAVAALFDAERADVDQVPGLGGRGSLHVAGAVLSRQSVTPTRRVMRWNGRCSLHLNSDRPAGCSPPLRQVKSSKQHVSGGPAR